MTGAEKVCEYFKKTKVFYVLTTDGDQPKGRPFGLYVPIDDKIYFGCGTWKNVYKQLTTNTKVEILAHDGDEFMRYDGIATVVKDQEVLDKIREVSPKVFEMYEKNGWELGVFYLANGHAEIRGMFDVKDEFDV